MGIVRSVEKLNIRWVTWWPVRYWTERFNALADRDDCALEVVFLGGGSRYLHCSVNEEDWRFRYRYLSKREDSSGYYAPNWRFRNPLSLLFPRCDALVMNYGEPACVAAGMACRILGWKYSIFAPNTVFDNRSGSLYRERLKSTLITAAHKVLVTGPRQREYVQQYRPSMEGVVEIGNPAPSVFKDDKVGLSSKDALRTQLGWGSETVLLYVGRFGEEKGLITLLRAARRLEASGQRCRTVLVGAGPLQQTLAELGEKWCLNLELLGFLEGEALARVYAAADVMVLPSLSEPWGLVVNEAMEFGLPLVLSDRVGSGPALLEDGKNGYLFSAGNEIDLASKIERLCVNPALRRTMGEESKSVIGSHSVSAWVDTVIDTLR